MKLQKGFSMVGLMAVVAIVAIIAVVSLPVYNQYIERTKVSKEIPVIGTYKNDIASCFMKNDSLDDCNDGESGIHPGLSDDGEILSLDVFKGNIIMVVNAQNHLENVEPIELMYMVNPGTTPVSSALSWTLYCNDYGDGNNALVKECKGTISDKDGDGYNDTIEEEWGSDPLDPDSVPENWQALSPLYTDWTNDGGLNYTTGWEPPVSNQTSDFEQTRDYEQTQTRERTDREQDSFSGDIRVVDTVTETQTSTGQETRTVVVNNTSNGWIDSGSAYNCSAWTPSASDYYETQMFDQTRSCSQNQENTYVYSIGGSFVDTQTVTVNETQEAEGTMPLWVTISDTSPAWTNAGGRNYTSSWNPEPNGQIYGFTQTRSYTQEQERTVEEREQNQLTNEIRVTNSTVQNRTVSGSEFRDVTVTEGNWQDIGAVFSCSTWSPDANTIDEGQVFSQNRDCLQKEEMIYTYIANGNVIATITIERDKNVTEARVATGTKEVWTSTSSSYSTWSNTGSRTYTGGWEPAASTQTSDFTQTRSYEQEQERTESIREENQSTGEIRTVSTNTQTQTISDTESRNVTVSEGAWVNDGGVYACGSWSPALNGQTSDFTQTRSCSQNQTKTYTYSIGGSYVDERTTTVTQSQLVEVTSTAGGDGDGWSNWSTYDTSCGTWGPAPSTVNDGQSFTQTRSCTDYQERFRYYVLGGQVIDSERETRTTSRTESQQATGTKLVSQCKYNGDLTTNDYSHVATYTGASYVWDGVVKKFIQNDTSIASESNPVDANDGFLYWAGDLKSSSGIYFYEICRKPK